MLITYHWWGYASISNLQSIIGIRHSLTYQSSKLRIMQIIENYKFSKLSISQWIINLSEYTTINVWSFWINGAFPKQRLTVEKRMGYVHLYWKFVKISLIDRRRILDYHISSNMNACSWGGSIIEEPLYPLYFNNTCQSLLLSDTGQYGHATPQLLPTSKQLNLYYMSEACGGFY